MSQPAPLEVERARECALLVLECCADLYEHGRKSTHPSTMADAIESATQKILAYHAQGSAEEAEKYRRLVEAAEAYLIAVDIAGPNSIKRTQTELRSALDALKEGK